MAEFRKLFYALGLASLLVGASSTANAQVQCTGSVANPPIIREESFTELIGDIVLDCTGGTPTTVGNAVLPINITITVSAPVTSRLLDTVTDPASGVFNEALLIIDEPNSPAFPLQNAGAGHRARPILACGAPTAVFRVNEFGATEHGVCVINGSANPDNTYNGDPNRPNVFQGRVSPSNSFQIRWNGVPFDPPGFLGDPPTPNLRHRILRFTNIRVASPSAAPVGQQLTTVFVELNINGQDITLNNRVLPVASVSKGIDPRSGLVEETDFLQCEEENETELDSVVFREGFASSFKVRGWAEIQRNGKQDPALTGPWVLDPALATYRYATTQLRQNLPGGLYFTESGFTSNSGHNNPAINAPVGTGSAQNLTGGTAITNPTNIDLAGVATNGTRIILTFKDIPAGSILEAPEVVWLYRAGFADAANRTGVAVRTWSTAQTARGDGAFTPVTGISPISGTGNRVVYEILFSRSQLIEDIRIPLYLTYTPNLPSDQPEVNKSALVTGGFAPFQLASDNFAVAALGSNTTVGGLPIPRFVTQTGDQKLYRIAKCSCNLLFPFTTNASTTNGNFDTGIAIANTSKLPAGFGFLPGTDQQGGVQFWYFPALSTSPAIATQCANTTAGSIGVCDNNRKLVKAGETLTYILSQNNTTWGLDNRAKGFTGYIVAQTGFQYCHAFAYISPEGAFPLTNGMSVGYLALLLDKDEDYFGEGGFNSLPKRTSSLGESLEH